MSGTPKPLTAYTFTFNGVALGGKMVVIAKSEKSAWTKARAALTYNTVHPDAQQSLSIDMHLTKTIGENYPMVVHFFNGDY